MVASGLQALMPSSVTGTRRSLERKLSFRKSSAMTMRRMSDLKPSVFVKFQ